MAELTERCESSPSRDSIQQAAEPETRPLPLDASSLALTRPGSLPSEDDGLLAPGVRLDKYAIIAKLGSGGMGQVYRVRHVRLEREFALKIISSRHITPGAVQRFEREMKAAGRTNHPNVILATDAGESRGLHYLAMELVPGTDLAGLVKRIGPLPDADACELIRPAARPSEPRRVAEALAPLSLGHNLPKLFDGTPFVKPGCSLASKAPSRCAVMTVGVVTLLVLVPGLLAWGRGAQRPPSDPTSARPGDSTPGTALPLRIESLEVENYRGNPTQLQGTIGVLAHAARCDDNVRVTAKLSAPGYCYLIALNPDGSIQLCPKSQGNAPPSRTSAIVYPAETDEYYGLTDGTGLQAFVLIASRKPLPPFASWPARAGLSWTKAGFGEAWRFDGHGFACLAHSDRGTPRHLPTTAPAPFVAACCYLGQLPDIDAIQATAFPVLPAEKSNPSPSPSLDP